MFIKNLWVMHNSVRDISNVLNLVKEVELNGWSNTYHNFLNIKIADFGDKRYVRDGLHRVLALYVLQTISKTEPCLHPKLCDIEYYNYREFEELNFECGWVTPFDPKDFVRKPDFLEYKNTAISIFKNDGLDKAEEYIRNNYVQYLEKREINTVYDLYEKYKSILTGDNNEKENNLGIITY